MSARRILVVGAGKRVLETALPALLAAAPELEIEAVCGRKERRVEAAGRAFDVVPLERLPASRLEACEFVYVAVGKQAVAGVLAALLERGAGRSSLLLETPGLLLKHLRHRPLIERFARAWIAEDCAFLPWLETVRAAAEQHDLGRVEGVCFVQSAYAYHGVATARALLGAGHVAKGTRKRIGTHTLRTLEFKSGGYAAALEPRDYAVGRLLIQAQRGAICAGGDDERFALVRHNLPPSASALRAALAPESFARALRLEVECVGAQPMALRCGNVRSELDLRERALALGPPPEAGIVARMESMKRVGFLRLVRRLLAGGAAHPVEFGLEDMLVDWWLERPGFWRDSALTSLRSGLGRALYGTLSRVAGGPRRG